MAQQVNLCQTCKFWGDQDPPPDVEDTDGWKEKGYRLCSYLTDGLLLSPDYTGEERGLSPFWNHTDYVLTPPHFGCVYHEADPAIVGGFVHDSQGRVVAYISTENP